MPHRPFSILVFAGVAMAVVVALAGCAASDSGETAALLMPAVASAPPPPPPSVAISKAGYVLSADEQALECKQLTGRMQIRILEIRDYNERNRTTLASRTLQSGTTAVFGGPKTGLDPAGAYAKDRAKLEAYNQQLQAKGCKAYDLEAELTPQDVRATPNATIKPASAAATVKP